MSYRKFEVRLLVLMLAMVLNYSAAQSQDWQVGIGLSPREEINPWYLIVKKRLDTKWNLRSGLGFSSRKYEESIYNQNVLNYNYIKGIIQYDIRMLAGLEYRMTWHGLQFFTAVDLSLEKYKHFERLKEWVLYDVTFVDPHSQVYDLAQFDKLKTISIGGRMNLGIEYFITRNASIVLESGLAYRHEISTRDRETYHTLFRDLDLQEPVDQESSIYTVYATNESRTSDFYFGLISLLTLQYHF